MHSGFTALSHNPRKISSRVVQPREARQVPETVSKSGPDIGARHGYIANSRKPRQKQQPETCSAMTEKWGEDKMDQNDRVVQFYLDQIDEVLARTSNDQNIA